MIFVFSYGYVVGPLKTGLYKLNGGSGRRQAGPHTPAGPTTHLFFLSQTLKWKKNVFRNPQNVI